MLNSQFRAHSAIRLLRSALVSLNFYVINFDLVFLKFFQVLLIENLLNMLDSPQYKAEK